MTKTLLARMIGTDGVGNSEVSEGATRTIVTPFPPDYPASGVLMHVVSLPSPYGVGDLGPGNELLISPEIVFGASPGATDPPP